MAIDSASYEAASRQVDGGKEKTPSLEEQTRLAKEREAAAKKVADDVIRSQGFAKKWNEELNLSRVGAPEILLWWFEDFTKPVLVNATPLSLNQRAPNTPPKIPEIGAQRPESMRSTVSAVPAKAEVPTTVDVLANGDTQPTIRQAQTVQRDIEAGKPGPDMKDVMRSIENWFAALPKWLQDFFKGILNFIKGISGNQDANSAISKLMSSPDWKAILDRLATSETTLDGKTAITFNEGVGITKSKKEKTPDWSTATTTEAKSTKIEGNKIMFEKDTKISSVKEYAGTVTIVAQNKDGSTDTYTVSNAREKTSAPPPAQAGSKVA